MSADSVLLSQFRTIARISNECGIYEVSTEKHNDTNFEMSSAVIF